MAEESTELLREMVSLLRQIAERQQRDAAMREEIAKAVGERNPAPDFEKRRVDHERRLQEIREEGDKRRLEDLEFREQLLTSLQRLIEILSRIQARLGEQGDGRDG